MLVRQEGQWSVFYHFSRFNLLANLVDSLAGEKMFVASKHPSLITKAVNLDPKNSFSIWQRVPWSCLSHQKNNFSRFFLLSTITRFLENFSNKKTLFKFSTLSYFLKGVCTSARMKKTCTECPEEFDWVRKVFDWN